MQQLINFLNDQNVFGFFLLFIRVNALFLFMPFFSQAQIPQKIRSAFSFWLSVLLLPLIDDNLPVFEHFFELVIAVLSEVLMGLISGLLVYLVLYALMYAGETISYTAGLSMASVMDPFTNIQMSIIGQFFLLVAVLLILILNIHHFMLQIIATSLQSSPIGGIVFSPNMGEFVMTSVVHFFIVGFTIGFPIVAFSIFMDAIFGMLMKTMPQFNMLVVGFPIKIAVSFIGLVIVFSAIFLVLKKEILEAIDAVSKMF